MARKFKAYVERPKPKKRPRVHKKIKINLKKGCLKNTIDKEDNGNDH